MAESKEKVEEFRSARGACFWLVFLAALGGAMPLHLRPASPLPPLLAPHLVCTASDLPPLSHSCHLAALSSFPPAEETEALKGREAEHWEKAKALGEEARAAGHEEMQRRLAQVGRGRVFVWQQGSSGGCPVQAGVGQASREPPSLRRPLD